MSEKQTPRTDALEAKLHDQMGHGSYSQALPLTRQLERELTAETDKVKRLRELAERVKGFVCVCAGPHSQCASCHAKATLDATK